MDKKARIRVRKAAQKFLARYHSPSLTEAQRNNFQPYFSADVLETIGKAATDEIDYTRLLKLIEGLEQTRFPESWLERSTRTGETQTSVSPSTNGC